MKPVLKLAAIAAILLTSAPAARAQSSEPRIEGGISFAQTVSATKFDATRTYRESAEDATFAASYKAKAAPGAAFHLQYNFSPKFGVRAGVQFASRKSDATITGQSPHPFFFSRPRAYSGEATGLGFSETGFSLTAVLRGRSGKWAYGLEAGPALFSVNATLAARPRLSETYPYDTTTFGGAETVKRKVSPVGVAVGVEFGRMVNDSVTVFVQGRYAGGSADADLEGTPVSVKAGGASARAGVSFTLVKGK